MSFQPFAVQCLTCGSSLRVTDPAIVGTIATCPKCNSMVQIERLGGQVAVGQSSVDSQAITEEAINPSDGAAGPSGQPTTATPFAGSDEVDSERTESAASATPPAWQSERTRRSRQIALVAAVSLSGLLGAVAVFSWFVHAWRRQATATQPVASANVDRPEPPKRQQAAELSEPPADADRSPDPSNGGDSEDTSPIQSVAEPDVDRAGSAVGPRQSDDPSRSKDLQPDSAIDPTPKPPLPIETVPKDLIPQSPIDQPPLAGPTVRRTDGPAAGAEPGGLQQLPPQLEKYTKFLLTEEATEEPTLKAPPTIDEIKIDAAAQVPDDPLLSSKPERLNLKADLAIRMALAADGYPLADLLLLVSQVTGVPIQIDWVSFDLAEIDINAHVPVQKGWRTARELLDETASALGAEIRPQDSLVILTLSDASFDETMAKVTNLQDFGGTRPSADGVLKQFLGNSEDDKTAWQLGQSREQQQLAALAVESLRRMRGLEPKVAEHRVRRWAGTSKGVSIDWPLLVGGDAGPQLDTPIAMAGFLQRTARRNQAICVVNWYDANHRGAVPKRLVFPHAEVDAASTLDQMLSVFRLQVRQVDPQHWWVGSEPTYDRLPIVIWTPPLGETRDAFIGRITSIMAGASRDVFRLAMDEQSDRALLLLPRYIAGQLPKISAGAK